MSQIGCARFLECLQMISLLLDSSLFHKAKSCRSHEATVTVAACGVLFNLEASFLLNLKKVKMNGVMFPGI